MLALADAKVVTVVPSTARTIEPVGAVPLPLIVTVSRSVLPLVGVVVAAPRLIVGVSLPPVPVEALSAVERPLASSEPRPVTMS